MILRTSPACPSGRKVKLAAAVARPVQIASEIVAADTMDPSDDLRTQNPLGPRIPILITDAGRSRCTNSRG